MKGFSLFELLLVLALVAILMTLTLPDLNSKIIREQAQQLEREVTNTVHYASRYARLTHQAIGVQTGAKEWLVFTISNHKKVLSQSLHHHGQLHWRSFPSNRNYLLIEPDGRTDNGTIWYCHPHVVWALIINKLGRLRAATPAELVKYQC